MSTSTSESGASDSSSSPSNTSVPTITLASTTTLTTCSVSTPTNTACSPVPCAGQVPIGTAAGVSTAFGLVAAGLALVLWLREKRWRRKSIPNGVGILNSCGGPQSEAVSMGETSAARSNTAPPAKGGFILAHQRTDNEILSPLRQLIAEINDLVQRFPNVPKSLSAEHIHDNEDVARIFLVLPQLRRIEDLPGHLGGRIQVKQFLRGLVACMAFETVRCHPLQDDIPPGTDKPTPARPAFPDMGTVRHRSTIVPRAASHGGDNWLSDDINSSIFTLRDALRPQTPSASATTFRSNISVFHEWRAMTYTLLGERYGDNYNEWAGIVKEYIQARAEAIMRLLQPWVGSNSSGDQHQQSLTSILIHALEFSCLLRRQRADWSLKFPETTSGTAESKRLTATFDATRMKDFRSAGGEGQPASGTHVQIFIAPALFKCGNMDGEKYESGYFTAQKAEVWCL